MERRREARMPVRGTGMLSWPEGRINRVEPVEVENVASDGLRVRVNHPLRLRQIVRLEGPNSSCFALVRYCQRLEEGWAVGLQLAGAARSAYVN